MVPAIIAAISEQIPAYRTLAPAQLAEVSAIASWATSRILELWARADDGADERSDLSPADVQRFRVVAGASSPAGAVLTRARTGSTVSLLPDPAGGPEGLGEAATQQHLLDGLDAFLEAGTATAAAVKPDLPSAERKPGVGPGCDRCHAGGFSFSARRSR